MVKIDLCDGWAPGHASSAIQRQTGWDLQKRWLFNYVFDRLPRHVSDLTQIWTDFLSKQRRATDFVETAGRAGGKRQPARCLRKTRDNFAIASMTKKLLYCYRGAHALMEGTKSKIQTRGKNTVFCWEYACISTCVVGTMHVQVCTLDRCCEHQRTYMRTRLLQDVHMHSCMCRLFIQRWATRTGGSN